MDSVSRKENRRSACKSDSWSRRTSYNSVSPSRSWTYLRLTVWLTSWSWSRPTISLSPEQFKHELVTTTSSLRWHNQELVTITEDQHRTHKRQRVEANLKSLSRARHPGRQWLRVCDSYGRRNLTDVSIVIDELTAEIGVPPNWPIGKLIKTDVNTMRSQVE